MSLAKTARPAAWWAMTLRRRGRFVEVASEVGRLLRLYDEAFARQVKSRLLPMGSNVHAHLADMVRRGALLHAEQSGKPRGRYVEAPPLPADDDEQVVLLASALYALEAESLPLEELISCDLLFPFRLDQRPRRLRSTPLLVVSYDEANRPVVGLPPALEIE